MHNFSLFAKAPNHPYSNATLYKEFIDNLFPMQTSKDFNLTYVALSAIFHQRDIPKSALVGTLGKRVQFFQETYSKGSKTFKKTLLRAIEGKKQEMENISSKNKKNYLKKHSEMGALLNEPIPKSINKKNLFYVFKRILPLKTSLSLGEKLKYSLSLESLTSKTMTQSQISTIISIIKNISSNDDESDLDDTFHLKEKIQFIAFVKSLTENSSDHSKIDLINNSSKIHPREWPQILHLIQSLSDQEMSKDQAIHFLIHIYSRVHCDCPNSKESFARSILLLVNSDMKESHIDILISDLACIPSSERPFISHLVKSLISPKTLDLTNVIKLSHFLSKYIHFAVPRHPTLSHLSEIIFLFTTYSPKKRPFLLDLITSLLQYNLTNLSGISSILSHDSETLESYNPTYIASRSQDFNHQEDYLQRSREVIAIGAKIINNADSTKKKLLFFTLLDHFSKKRGMIAKDQKTKSAENFGVRRDFNTPKGAIAALTTPLYGPYQECGRKLLDFLKPHINEIITNPFKDLIYEFKERTLGCQSILKIALLDRHTVQELHSQKISVWHSTSLNKKIHNIQQVLSRISNAPPKNSEAFLVEFSVSIEIRKRHLLTQYYTWASKDPSNSNELHFSKVVVLHQDHSLIQKTLDEAAQIFEELMDLDGKDLSCFQEKLALLTYILAHNARDRRGSAAETEWLVHAICLAKNLHISEDPNRLQDLEAFSNPLLADYIEAHKDMIKLRRNNYLQQTKKA